MVFNSLLYLLFLPLVYLLFCLAGERWRLLLLILASFVFYAVLKVPYLLGALLLTAVLSFYLGQMIAASPHAKTKWRLLQTGIWGNLTILISLKYLPFIFKNLNTLSSSLKVPLHLPQEWMLVSIGVSYYVFQAISYLIDIYLETTEPEKHFGYFTLYLIFFPKLMQGPIERAHDLLPQLRAPYVFNYKNVRSGLLLFLWGMFKKLVVADRLAMMVNEVYDHLNNYAGISIVLATYLYAFQLYCDFSGYTDMALGSARIFNIELTQNFNRPYTATSIAEFWRRWHISFSRWILNYIFTPLQMVFRQAKNWGTALALFITFLASGIWHGANWNFIVWGLIHGSYLAVSTMYKKTQKKMYKALGLEKTRLQRYWQTFVTFHLVCLSWVYFRASSVKEATSALKSVFGGLAASLTGLKDYELRKSILYLAQGAREFWIGLIMVMVVFAVNNISTRYQSIDQFLARRNMATRWMIYYLLCFSLLVFSIFNSNTFVYFQF